MFRIKETRNTLLIVTTEEDRRNTMGEAEIFAVCLIPKSSLSGKWIDISKQTTKIKFEGCLTVHLPHEIM